jgi:hypothetical protein
MPAARGCCTLMKVGCDSLIKLDWLGCCILVNVGCCILTKGITNKKS